jgi:hypothetical protein
MHKNICFQKESNIEGKIEGSEMAENQIIGPYNIANIALCSLDAAPRSQRTTPGSAEFFFPGARWVGATRNAAQRLGCQFVILTGEGMVNPADIIKPYDLALTDETQDHIRSRWVETIPNIIGNHEIKIMVTYFGGCPREPILELLCPILHDNNFSLLTFGRPNMFDIGKIDDIVEKITLGSTFNNIKDVLSYPDRLLFYQ